MTINVLLLCENFNKLLNRVFNLSKEYDWLYKKYSLIENSKIIFVINQTGDDEIRHKDYYDIIISLIPSNVQGSACSALYAASVLNLDNELLIVGAGEFSDINIEDFINRFRIRKAKAGVIGFKSNSPIFPHIVEENGYVVESSQDRVISDDAIRYIFWFSSVKTFVDACQSMIIKGVTVDDSYCISNCLNEIILNNGKVALERINVI